MNIKQLIGKHNDGTANEAQFVQFRQGNFYYKVKSLHDGEVYQFIVPAEEIGDATILRNDKAIGFMKWIAKAIRDNTLVKAKP